MRPKVETWMFYRGGGKEQVEDLAAVTVSAAEISVNQVSQYIDLRDRAGKTFLTLTWPSAVKVRKIGA